MKNIRFKQLAVVDIEGNEHQQDFSRIIGNTIFNMADDVAEHDLGIKIYPEGDAGTDIEENEERILRKYLPAFKYVLRKAIEDAMA